MQLGSFDMSLGRAHASFASQFGLFRGPVPFGLEKPAPLSPVRVYRTAPVGNVLTELGILGGIAVMVFKQDLHTREGQVQWVSAVVAVKHALNVGHDSLERFIPVTEHRRY
jgi:hypothetical protein